MTDIQQLSGPDLMREVARVVLGEDRIVCDALRRWCQIRTIANEYGVWVKILDAGPMEFVEDPCVTDSDTLLRVWNKRHGTHYQAVVESVVASCNPPAETPDLALKMFDPGMPLGDEIVRILPPDVGPWRIECQEDSPDFDTGGYAWQTLATGSTFTEAVFRAAVKVAGSANQGSET